LKDILLDGHRSETSQFQAHEIESQDALTTTAHHIKTQPIPDKTKQQRCGYCGGHFPHKGTCPAKGENPANAKTERKISNRWKLTMKMIPVLLMIIYIRLQILH